MPPEEGSACNAAIKKRLGNIVGRREVLRFAQNDGNAEMRQKVVVPTNDAERGGGLRFAQNDVHDEPDGFDVAGHWLTDATLGSEIGACWPVVMKSWAFSTGVCWTM